MKAKLLFVLSFVLFSYLFHIPHLSTHVLAEGEVRCKQAGAVERCAGAGYDPTTKTGGTVPQKSVEFDRGARETCLGKSGDTSDKERDACQLKACRYENKQGPCGDHICVIDKDENARCCAENDTDPACKDDKKKKAANKAGDHCQYPDSTAPGKNTIIGSNGEQRTPCSSFAVCKDKKYEDLTAVDKLAIDKYAQGEKSKKAGLCVPDTTCKCKDPGKKPDIECKYKKEPKCGKNTVCQKKDDFIQCIPDVTCTCENPGVKEKGKNHWTCKHSDGSKADVRDTMCGSKDQACQPDPSFGDSLHPGVKCSDDVVNNQNAKIKNPPPPPSPPCIKFDAKKGTCTSITSAFGDLATDPAAFITKFFAILLSLSGGVALLLIIKSGYLLMVSQGKPEQLQQGREQLTAAIVGLLFLIFSFVLLQVIGVDILKIPEDKLGNVNKPTKEKAADPKPQSPADAMQKAKEIPADPNSNPQSPADAAQKAKEIPAGGTKPVACNTTGGLNQCGTGTCVSTNGGTAGTCKPKDNPTGGNLGAPCDVTGAANQCGTFTCKSTSGRAGTCQ